MLTLDAPVAKKTRKPAPKAQDRKGVVAHIRGSAEFKAWLDEFAERERFTVSTLFERALVLLAKEAGFREPPLR